MKKSPVEAPKFYVTLTDSCVRMLEKLTPLNYGVLKVKVGDLWECVVSEEEYSWLNSCRKAGESWSECITRMVRESRRLDKVMARTT